MNYYRNALHVLHSILAAAPAPALVVLLVCFLGLFFDLNFPHSHLQLERQGARWPRVMPPPRPSRLGFVIVVLRLRRKPGPGEPKLNVSVHGSALLRLVNPWQSMLRWESFNEFSNERPRHSSIVLAHCNRNCNMNAVAVVGPQFGG